MGAMPAATTGAAATAPLDVERLRAALIVSGGVWTDIRVTARTSSTNSDVSALAAQEAPEGLVIATEWQTSGRGRQGRRWHANPRAALTFSVLLRPRHVPQPVRGWVPLLAGVATASAVSELTAAQVGLKWPNDVLIGERKLAGILAEQSGDAIVVGIGLNVFGQPADLPVPTATSLELHAGPAIDRTELLAEILRRFAAWYRRWSMTGPGDPEASGLREEYLRLCGTVGRPVNVQLPGGRTVAGTAVGVDGTGRLVVSTGAGRVPVSAGDVIHVR
jgi:biotin-[acetyl-CoA-carboxylase] ligase BirA-like protein